MDLQASEEIFQKCFLEIGLSHDPVFHIVHPKVGASMVYLNKAVPFSILEASIGVPKTSSQMKAVYLLNVASEEFESFKQKGIYCSYPGYRHHETIGEVKRMPHPSLNENVH